MGLEKQFCRGNPAFSHMNISSRDKETAAEFLAGTAELAVPRHKTQPRDSFRIYKSWRRQKKIAPLGMHESW